MAKAFQLNLAAHSVAGLWRRDKLLQQARALPWCNAQPVDCPDELVNQGPGALIQFDTNFKAAEIMLAAVCQGVPIGFVGSGGQARPNCRSRMLEASASLHFPFNRRAARNLAKRGTRRSAISVCGDPLEDLAHEHHAPSTEKADIIVALDETRLLDDEARILWSALSRLYGSGAIERVLWLGEGPSRRTSSAGISRHPVPGTGSFNERFSVLTGRRIIISDIDWVLDLAPVMGWSICLVRPQPDRPELAVRCRARLCPFDPERLPVEILSMLMQSPVSDRNTSRPAGKRAAELILSHLERLFWRGAMSPAVSTSVSCAGPGMLLTDGAGQ